MKEGITKDFPKVKVEAEQAANGSFLLYMELFSHLHEASHCVMKSKLSSWTPAFSSAYVVMRVVM